MKMKHEVKNNTVITNNQDSVRVEVYGDNKKIRITENYRYC